MSPNTLAQTSADEIRKLHGELLEAARTTLDKAIRIGQLLKGVRASLAHGEWLPWCERNLPFTARTASNYVRVFEDRDRLKSETVSDLTDAYAFLAAPELEPLTPEEAAELARLETRIEKGLAELRRQGFTDEQISAQLIKMGVPL